VEPDGERTFISHHGAEYRFSKKWMEGIDVSAADSLFVCGLEVEEPTGGEIVEFAEAHRELRLYFAPGPRIRHIPPERMARLFALGPFLHLNRAEALGFTGAATVEAAADFLAAKTGSALVITCGEEGAYYREEAAARGCMVPAPPRRAVDSTGAGDAHCGALIACLKQGRPLGEAVAIANRAAAAGLTRSAGAQAL
jgi:sugar/nucleoside kinase (ribokinase family)